MGDKLGQPDGQKMSWRLAAAGKTISPFAGDVGPDAIDQREEIERLWKLVNHDEKFLLYDQGVGIGVILAVSYDTPSHDCVLKKLTLEDEFL